jgi:small subunit ribosomal protein S3Ae
MAIGKNKRLTKGKKGQKKKIIDSMSRKDWLDFKAPAPFDSKPFGKTCITKSSGTRIATDVIRGRVVEVSLADLKNNSDNMAWRKVKLQVEDVDGNSCRTSFYGMDMTRDKLCSFIRKWQSLVESVCEVKTMDGTVLRCFVIGFTKKRDNQISKTSYANR